ncbi:MAG: TonB-dependent receptor [Bryobacterales bacterium]|nr:TonB-dependent receptor [Bryobacterales bacterium]
MNLRNSLRLTAIGLIALFALEAQIQPTGSVEGIVKDQSNSVVAGAKVSIVNTQTGVKQSAATNDLGLYRFPLVLPGTYRVEATQEGFQTYVQEFRVQTGIQSSVNIVMRLGEVKQVTEVTAVGASVEAASASLSAVITNRQVSDLPLAGRNPYQLMLLSPGVVQTSPPRASDMQDVNTAYVSANGANQRMNEFLMDGVPNNISDRVAYIPPVDQVEEFNVQTNTFDAEYGHAGGAIINVVTKTGTNSYHGSIYDFLRNSALDANNFYNNKTNIGKAPFRFNQFGVTAGGPVIKNRLFWFANYEGIRQARPSTSVGTVPTSQQIHGDFSQTFDAKNNLIKVFDPYSTRSDPNNPAKFIRDQFPGNSIPGAQIDPVARNLAAFLPAPMSAGDRYTGTNNYSKTLMSIAPMNDISIRTDFELSSRNRFFGRASREQTNIQTDYLVDIGGKVSDKRIQASIGIGDTFMISPATIVDASAGFTKYTRAMARPVADMIKLGFPAGFVSKLEEQKVPTLSITDMVGFGAGEGDRYDNTYTWAFQANLRHIQGRHSMKWGFQTQIKQSVAIPGSRPSGTYTFNRAFTQGPDPTAKGSNIGDGIASYLLGLPASGYVSTRASQATAAPYYGFYFHDDFRVSQRLTLNLGVRYEILFPATERYARMNTGFAYTTANPIAAQAQANYANHPIAELPVSQFQVLGGLMFPDQTLRRAGFTDKGDWSPRLGLAYRINDKTVFRGGFGFFYTYWWAPYVQQLGFSVDTPYAASIDGITPLNHLSNPFPDGLIAPMGASQGLATLLGTGMSFYDQYRTQPYNKRWSLGFQRQLTHDIRAELNYVGSTGMDVPVGSGSNEDKRELHYLPQKFLPLQSRLLQTVSNPFFGLLPVSSALGAKTISVQNLLSTYPEFTSVTATRQTFGKSYYHSLQASLTKNFSHGFQFLSSYTFSKSVEKIRFLDPSDAGLTKMLGDLDRPQRFTIGGVFELPFGAGKPWAASSNAVNKFISGWQLNVIQTFQSGEGLVLPANLATGIDPRLDPGARSIDNWFNGAAFSVLPAFTSRSLPLRLASLRADAIDNWDLSLVKETSIRDRFRVQFRWETFNSFNRPQFGAPNLSPASGAYTRISSQVNNPRDMQFGLKVLF